ncbi:MAG: DNA-directed RNA polymerase subunit alpha [Patescibacteria group bacterium]|jgi:DNA-directed RNA polymerase subunit alpha|nr:DNA-directed RNA polymerase subunit alpha [Patescibacteria group bacterium]
MQNIALPNKISLKEGDQENKGQVIIEPCFPGYGITIGNSLRRVLLSSLEGAAVVGVKIEGVDHEFMSLAHVKEDILEILMNLKELRIKMFTDEVVKLSLSVAGKKIVKASDIKADSSVEVVNKDLNIATLTDMAGNINMEIFVKKGIGYETIEAREEKTTEIGYLEIDSIFSPVLNIGIDIDNVRVGKMTNWDRLVIDILTDGTITPAEAFRQANEILIDQFSSLSEDKKDKTEEKEEEEVDDKVKEEVATDDDSAKEANDDEPTKKRGRPKKSE